MKRLLSALTAAALGFGPADAAAPGNNLEASQMPSDGNAQLIRSTTHLPTIQSVSLSVKYGGVAVTQRHVRKSIQRHRNIDVRRQQHRRHHTLQPEQ